MNISNLLPSAAAAPSLQSATAAIVSRIQQNARPAPAAASAESNPNESEPDGDGDDHSFHAVG